MPRVDANERELAPPLGHFAVAWRGTVLRDRKARPGTDSTILLDESSRSEVEGSKGEPLVRSASGGGGRQDFTPLARTTPEPDRLKVWMVPAPKSIRAEKLDFRPFWERVVPLARIIRAVFDQVPEDVKSNRPRARAVPTKEPLVENW